MGSCSDASLRRNASGTTEQYSVLMYFSHQLWLGGRFEGQILGMFKRCSTPVIDVLFVFLKTFCFLGFFYPNVSSNH